jgi:hypothetical protein
MLYMVISWRQKCHGTNWLHILGTVAVNSVIASHRSSVTLPRHGHYAVWVDSKCFTEFTEFFWTFYKVLYFKKTQRFGNWICFRPQMKVREKTPTQLGSLERANLNHWTPLSDLHSYLIIWATHVGASSQFLLCNFLLSPAELTWSQMIK